MGKAIGSLLSSHKSLTSLSIGQPLSVDTSATLDALWGSLPSFVYFALYAFDRVL